MYLTMKENVSRKYGIQNLAHTVIQHVQLIYDVLNTIFTSFGVKSGLRDLKWYRSFKRMWIDFTNFVFISFHSRSHPLESVRMKISTTFDVKVYPKFKL